MQKMKEYGDEGGKGKLISNGSRVSLWGDERALEMVNGILGFVDLFP